MVEKLPSAGGGQSAARLTADQLAAIRQDVVRGQRALEAFIRGEGPAPGFDTLATMPVDPIPKETGRGRKGLPPWSGREG
jgi:hypothetical protein